MRRLMLHTLQNDNLKTGQRLRARLRGDHAAEPGHGPGPDVVVLGAGRDEELLREGHLGDGRPVHGEGLEELGAVADRFWVLDDDPHCAGAGAVRDLDPVAAQTCRGKGREVRQGANDEDGGERELLGYKSGVNGI